MDADEPSVFRTKTGTCTVTSDRIVLVRQGVRGKLARILFGESVWRGLLVYCTIAGFLAAVGISFIRTGGAVRIAHGVVFCVLAAALFLNVIMSRHCSGVSEVPTDTIEHVDVHPPRPPWIRGYFAVLFRRGKTLKKRLIMLPGSWDDGQVEFEKAVKIFEDQQLTSEGLGSH